MNTKELLLSKNFIVFNEKKGTCDNTENVGKILVSLASLNYSFTKDSIDFLVTLPTETLKKFYFDVFNFLKNVSGTKINKGLILFNDFPNVNLNSTEMYFIQQLHYFSTYGAESLGLTNIPVFIPNNTERVETEDTPTTKITYLKIIDSNKAVDVLKVYVKETLEKPVAINNNDKDLLLSLIKKEKSLIPTNLNFQFKENIFVYFGLLLDTMTVKQVISKNNLDYLTTITDVLRLYRFLCDRSALMMNTKIHYESFPRSIRKIFLSKLNELCKNNLFAIDDFNRHYFDWIIVFEKLHPGDYKQYKNILHIASDLRNDKYTTFNGKVVSAINSNDLKAAANLLKIKPGEFARNLDFVLRKAKDEDKQYILNTFKSVANKISVPVLLQLYDYYLNRNSHNERVFIIHTETGNNKVFYKLNDLPDLSQKIIDNILSILADSVRNIKSSHENLGKVYIGENMKNYALPGNDRNGSDNLKAVPKGSIFNVGDIKSKIIRLFAWWCNTETERIDIDLATLFVSDDFSTVQEYSWRNYYYSIKSKSLSFSGDITSAPRPKGASEYTDINVDSFLKEFPNFRYIVVTISSYTSIPFKEFECFSGISLRNNTDKNFVLYDPKTVLQKFRLTGNSTILVATVFDIYTNKICLIDSACPNSRNVSIAGETINAIIPIIKRATRQKLSMYDLVKMEDSFFEIVDKKEDADLVIDDADDADIRPWDQEKFSTLFM